MAKFYINDFVKANDISSIIAVTWQVAEDPDFNNIIAETKKNREAVDIWETDLKCSDGSYCPDGTKVYARCKIHTENNGEIFESDWFVAKDLRGIDAKELVDPNGNLIGKIVYDDSPEGYKILW